MRGSRSMFLIACLAGAMALVATTANGQLPRPLDLQSSPLKNSVQSQRQEPVIGVRVTEILLPITVTNSSGNMVFDLTKEDFQVFDDGIMQDIEHFDLGGDPLSIVLVAETSSRIQPLLPAIRKTGIVFGQIVMAQTAEASIITFDDSVAFVEEFTSDRERIENAIEHLKIGTSGTRLYDAMAQGVAMLGEQPSTRRRILVVLGEALDRGSENKLGEVLRRAQLANVAIYTIGLSTTAATIRAEPRGGEPTPIAPPGTYPIPTPGGKLQTPQPESQMQGNIDLLAVAEWLVRTGKNAVGSNSLVVASGATGGLAVGTTSDRDIIKAMDSIGGEIHSQYVLGYRTSEPEDTGYHAIRIELRRPNMTVRTRPGYYLAPAGP